MYSTKISTGWPTSRGREFRPQEYVKRDAMATFLYRYAGEPSYAPPKVSPFIDVSPTHTFYKEMTWLHARGISTGWPTDAGREYRPFEPINRDVMAAFLYTVSPENHTPDRRARPHSRMFPWATRFSWKWNGEPIA
mgnify:CR=1 FL=1